MGDYMRVTFSVITKEGGHCTKHISLSGDGTLIKNASQCRIGRGFGDTVTVEMADMPTVFDELKFNQAITLGVNKYSNTYNILADRWLKKISVPKNVYARSKENFIWSQNSLLCLDIDDGDDDAVSHLIKIFPPIADAARLTTASVSAGIWHGDELLSKKGGIHIYIPIKDGNDAHRFGQVLFHRSWLHGFGFIKISNVGGLLVRSELLDGAVFSPERLIFESHPILEAPLIQKRPRPVFKDGCVLDTQKFPDLTTDELEEYEARVTAAKEKIKPKAEGVRTKWVKDTAKTQKISLNQAEKIISDNVLPLSFVLKTDDHGEKTFGELIEGGETYDGCTLADPLEPWRTNHAKFFLNAKSGKPLIHSFSHGERIYKPAEARPLSAPTLSLSAEMHGCLTDNPMTVSSSAVPLTLSAPAPAPTLSLSAEMHGCLSDDPKTMSSADPSPGNLASHPDQIPADYEKKLEASIDENCGSLYSDENKKIIADMMENDEPRWINLRMKLKKMDGVQITHFESAVRLFKKKNTDLSDSIRSKMLLREHGTDIRYCFDRTKWMLWDGKRWAFDETEKIFRHANALVDDLPVQQQSKLNIDRMVGLAARQVPSLFADFDKDPYVINLANGSYSLDTGKLTPHSRDQMHSQIAGANYDPDAECPLWLSCLNDWFLKDKETVRFIQQAVGYSLSATNMEHVMFILYGGGSNGKTIFLNTLRHIIGEYAQSTPTDTFLITQSEASNDLAALSKARFVTAAETEDGKQLSTALVKRMTGGDPVTCRYLYSEFFTYTPGYTIFLAVNHRPRIVNQDHGIWRRLKLIPFDFFVNEAIKDPQLENKLKKEADGIMAWALRGHSDYRKNGLVYPAKILEAINEYKNAEDVLAEFISIVCADTPGGRWPQPLLWNAYKNFCLITGEKGLGKKKFNSSIRERGYSEHKYQGGWVWENISPNCETCHKYNSEEICECNGADYAQIV